MILPLSFFCCPSESKGDYARFIVVLGKEYKTLTCPNRKVARVRSVLGQLLSSCRQLPLAAHP